MGNLGVSSMGKTKRKFTDAVKRAAVADYVSGRKSAAQVATEHEISTTQVYQWKVKIEEQDKGVQVDELEASGRSREDAKFILELQAERDAYQRTVGEQTMIIELLKKRLRSTNSQQRSELTGLIETLELAVRKRKHGKS
jgi:transposase-like protein